MLAVTREVSFRYEDFLDTPPTPGTFQLPLFSTSFHAPLDQRTGVRLFRAYPAGYQVDRAADSSAQAPTLFHARRLLSKYTLLPLDSFPLVRQSSICITTGTLSKIIRYRTIVVVHDGRSVIQTDLEPRLVGRRTILS